MCVCEHLAGVSEGSQSNDLSHAGKSRRRGRRCNPMCLYGRGKGCLRKDVVGLCQE